MSLELIKTVPDHVAIVAMGPSTTDYMHIVKGMGGRNGFCDETWGINAMGNVVVCDRIFHMDDVRVQQRRADAKNQTHMVKLVEWMKTHPGPIYTSQTHPDYPGLVEYPLEDVLNTIRAPYLNNTGAMAVAYAIHIGVKRMSLFGFDYTYPNYIKAERGRACVEFLLGYALAKGIKVTLTKRTTLLDKNRPWSEVIYGYDCMDLKVNYDPDADRYSVEKSVLPEEQWPTAEQVEANYNHGKHPNDPNQLISGEAA